LCYQWIIHACSETDLRKIKFYKFFFIFLFFSVRHSDGLSWCLDGGSLVGRTVLFTFGRAWHQRPDGKVTRPDANDLFAYFRGNVRPDGVHDPSGRGPHRLYIYPGRRTFTLPHQKVFFWPLVNDFLQDFGIILPFLVFLCINLTFQVFF
jgi:hypothetical protein